MNSTPASIDSNNNDPDFHLQAALEELAGNAILPPTPSDPASTSEPISTTQLRWSTLFSLSPDFALEAIHSHRQDLTRLRVTPEHWNAIRAQYESLDYNKEAYEYSLALAKQKARLGEEAASSTNDSGVTRFLLEMSGPLNSVQIIQHVAEMAELPVPLMGESVEESREVQVVCISSAERGRVLQWAAGEGKGFEPTILVDPRTALSSPSSSSSSSSKQK